MRCDRDAMRSCRAVVAASRSCRRRTRRGRARATSASRPACSRRAAATRSPTSPACASATSTLDQGDAVRTGVTAIVPHAGNLFQDKVPGAVFVGNAFGKLAGSTQVDELGTIETPIVLTNTLGVGAAMEGVVRWTLAQPGNDDVRSVNALVGETNDGGLNDIRGLHVRPRACRSRRSTRRDGGAVDEGSVGAGTGTQAFGWKGGIGTASRRLDGALRRLHGRRAGADATTAAC